jgi:hypothetical protein
VYSRGKQTFDEMRNEAHFIPPEHVALAGDTDCGQYVIASTHHIANSCFIQLGNDTGGTGLQFVLKDDETKEF